MIAKEWWEARWKFVLAAVVVLVFVVLAPRSYQAIQEFVEAEIQRTNAEIASPEDFMPQGEVQVPPGELQPPPYTEADYKEELRSSVKAMSRPDYLVGMAEQEVLGVHMGASLVLVPLAALLGVALVSGEVSRGTIFLLLSRPISRTRILLTKYLIGVAVIFAVALLGGVGVVASGYAHGYPAASIDPVRILAQSGLFWLGTVSVLGVATLASVLFRDMFRSVVATAVALYAVFSLPDLLREVAWWLSPPLQEDLEGPVMRDGWYDSFEAFRITNYWFIPDTYGGPFGNQQPDPVLSLLICVATAVLPLLAALWIFRRRSY